MNQFNNAIPERVPEERLRSFVTEALAAVGLPAVSAARAANVIIEADLRGIDTHGVAGLPSRIEQLRSGGFRPDASPRLERRVGAAALFDGQHGYGPALCSAVIEDAADLTAEHGIGLVCLRNSSHWGCPAYYSRWLANKGLIGIAISNTNPAMPLWGSSVMSIGNNPLTIAAPRRGAEPVVLDMSMQQISWGGLKLAKKEGRTLPGPWGYDTSGRPTNDPAHIIESGRVRPMGDYKGSGLAFMLEILTGLISFGATAYQLAAFSAKGEPAHYSQTFMAIRIDLFGDRQLFLDRMETFYATAKSSAPDESGQIVELPGDRSNRTFAQRRREGIPTRRISAAIEEISASLAISPPW